MELKLGTSKNKCQTRRYLFWSLLVASLGLPLFAMGQANANKWQFREAVDEVSAKTACHATLAKQANTAFELSFVAVKDRSEVPYLQLKIWTVPPANGVESKYFIAIPSKQRSTFYLTQASNQPDQPNQFWYAPTDFDLVLERIINDNTLKIQNAAGKDVALVPLSGSSVALAAVKKCLGGEGHLPSQFLKSLNAPLAQLPPVDEVGSLALWRSVRLAFKATLEGAAHQKALQLVKSQIAALEPKEKTAKTNFDKAYKTWETSHNKWTGFLAEVDRLKQLNDRLKSEVTQLEQELPGAQADLAQIKAAYDPLKAQVQPLETEVDELSSALNRLNSDIQSAERTISRNESKISDLMAERERLMREIPGIESELASAQRSLRDAQSNLDRFDVPSQIRDRLWRHPWYNSKVQERDRLERDIQYKRQDLRNAEFRERDLQRQVTACRSQPGANCSSLESELSTQQMVVRRIESDLSSMESNLRNLQWDIQRIEQEVRQEVEGQRNSLISERNDRANRVSQIQDNLAAKERRKRDIEGEIPILRSQNADLRAALPGMRIERDNKSTQLRLAEARLVELKQRLGFEAVESAYLAARDRVNQIQAGIRSRTNAIKQNDASIVNNQTQADKIKPTVEKNLAAKNKAEADLKAIQNQLAPLRADLSRLDQLIAEAAQLYQRAKGQYQALLKAL